MRKLLTILACTGLLTAGPCMLKSWNVAVGPGIGDKDAFVGVDLDFGSVDFVLPLIQFEN